MSLNFDSILKMADDFNKLADAGENLESLASLLSPSADEIQEALQKIDTDLQTGFKNVVNAVGTETLASEWKPARVAIKDAFDYANNRLIELNTLPTSINAGDDPKINPIVGHKLSFTHWCFGSDGTYNSGILDGLQSKLENLYNQLNPVNGDTNSGINLYPQIINAAQADPTNPAVGNLGTDLAWHSMSNFVDGLYRIITTSYYVYQSALQLLQALGHHKHGYSSLQNEDFFKMFGKISNDSTYSSSLWNLLPGLFSPFKQPDKDPMSVLNKSAYTVQPYNAVSNPWPTATAKLTEKGGGGIYFATGKPVSLIYDHQDCFFLDIGFTLPDKYTDYNTPKVESQDLDGHNPMLGLVGRVGYLNQYMEVCDLQTDYPSNDYYSNQPEWWHYVEYDRRLGLGLGCYVTDPSAQIDTYKCEFPTPPAASSENHLVVVTGFQFQLIQAPNASSGWDLVVAVQYGEIDLTPVENPDSNTPLQVTLLQNGDFIAPNGKDAYRCGFVENTSLGRAGFYRPSEDGTSMVNQLGIVTNIALGNIDNQNFNAPVVEMAPTFFQGKFMQPANITGS